MQQVSHIPDLMGMWVKQRWLKLVIYDKLGHLLRHLPALSAIIAAVICYLQSF